MTLMKGHNKLDDVDRKLCSVPTLPISKRLNTAILVGVEVLRTKGTWGTTLRRMGHSSGAPPRRGTVDDSQRANEDLARRTISQFYTLRQCRTWGQQSGSSSTSYIPL